MPITSLSFTNVGPFDEVEFAFDPQVNIFTGPNNSGNPRRCGYWEMLRSFPSYSPRNC